MVSTIGEKLQINIEFIKMSFFIYPASALQLILEHI